MPATLYEVKVKIINRAEYLAIVQYNNRMYLISYDCLRYDTTDNTYYVNIAYLIKERITL